MLINQDDVQERLRKLFPFLMVDGWAYKGFGIRSDDGAQILRFYFQKSINGRLAWARLPLPVGAVTASDFDLKEFFEKNLRAKEEEMVNRYLAEFAGAA